MDTQTYRILVLGDFHYGDSYRGGAKILADHGYDHSVVHLRPFVDVSDKFVVNLETPLVDPRRYPSPLTGRKKYIHWANPEATPQALKALGVDAVGLANNHTVDHGVAGLESTFEHLSQAGIPWFGAGRNLAEAREPLRISLPDKVGGGEILLHASFQYQPSHDDYGFYASDETPGCAPVSPARMVPAASFEQRPDSYHIAFPHWGANYNWRTDGQYRIANRLLSKGYNLLLGHGSHCVQEVLRSYQRWSVYSIGNGNFQAKGRFDQFEAEIGVLPYSLWAIIEIRLHGGERSLALKLYPVYSDNTQTGYQPSPVTEEDFQQIVAKLSEVSPNRWRFDNRSQRTSVDELGHHLELDLGMWPLQSPARNLPPLGRTGDPGDLPLRSPSVEVEDAITRLYRGNSLGPALLAMAAERHGATTEWMSANKGVIHLDDRRLLLDGYMVHESSLSERICKDKALTGRILASAGVSTPEESLATTADEAVAAATSIKGPVVIKPIDGNKSRGVSVGLTDDQQVRSAFFRAAEISSRVLVQQHIEAESEYRMLASATECVAVIRRILPYVIGDGVSTIGELIIDKNAQRQLNPSLQNRPIPVDDIAKECLSRQGWELDDVPAEEAWVTVRNVGSLSGGGESHQALDETSHESKQAAVGAVAAIPGLAWAGVDIIQQKGTGKPYVVEVNTRAAYGAALFPSFGEPKDVASVVWQLRHQASAKDTTEPAIAADSRTASPVDSLLGAGTLSQGRRLALLFFSWARSKGYELEVESAQVRSLMSPTGRSFWFTNAALTGEDLSVVTQAVRQHGVVRRLLTMAGVRRVRGTRITSAEQLRKYSEDKSGDFVATPASTPWGSDSSVRRDISELPAELTYSQPWFVQHRPEGVRLRVAATRERAIFVLTPEGVDRIPRAASKAACLRAVEAVRAIPELRWAVVDLVVRSGRLTAGASGACLVEGVSLNPLLSPNDHVIAGDVEAFFSWLLNPSQLSGTA